MKQMISLALALAMGLSLAACSGKDAKNTEPTSDLAYVQDKGTLVVGITEFEPMDYQDENGNWVGFDADMATLFAESLGVDVEFQLIDWDSKIMELDGKTIDVAWNGMTLTEDVKEAMECSNPYFNNAQVVVVKADQADKYQTVDSIQDLSFSVESGSAGMEQAEAYSLNYTPAKSQANTLLEVASGTSDAAIIDSSWLWPPPARAPAMKISPTPCPWPTSSTAWASAKAPTWRKSSTSSSPRSTPTAPCRRWRRSTASPRNWWNSHNTDTTEGRADALPSVRS